MHGFTGHKDWMDKCVCLLTAFSERMRRVPVALPEMVRALSAHQQTLKQVCGGEGTHARTRGRGEEGIGGWGHGVGLLELSPRAQVCECVAVEECVQVSPWEYPYELL